MKWTKSCSVHHFPPRYKIVVLVLWPVKECFNEAHLMQLVMNKKDNAPSRGKMYKDLSDLLGFVPLAIVYCV